LKEDDTPGPGWSHSPALPAAFVLDPPIGELAMTHLPIRPSLISATLVTSLAIAGAHGQILSDGDFDALPFGSRPDCTEAAGAWGWLPIYVGFGLCEVIPFQVWIDHTDSIEPGAPGKSLNLNNNIFSPPG